MKATVCFLFVASLMVPGALAQPTPLVPPIPLEGSRLGRYVAATADWAAVSTVPRFIGDERFYMFRRFGGEWVLDAEITDVSGGVGFRGAVAASGKCVLAGAPWDSYEVPGGGPNAGFQAGSTYVYCRMEEEWTLDGVLRPSDPAQDGLFGQRIALSGAVAAAQSVGGYLTPADSMAVYVHRRDAAGWVQEAKLRPWNLPSDAYFGAALTASADLVGAAVSVPVGMWEREESYWVFAYSDGKWETSDTLRAGSSGGAVLAGSRLFLGDPTVPGSEGVREGIVRIYERVGGDFVPVDSLVSDLQLTPDPFDEECPFGWVLDATPDTLIAAHHCDWSAAALDTIEVYVRGVAGWERVARSALGFSDENPSWPRSFSLSGRDLIVGLPGSNEHGAGAGAAYAVPLDGLITASEPEPVPSGWRFDGPHPNPTRGLATFRLRATGAPLIVRVSDVLGRMLHHATVDVSASDGAFRLDLRHLPAGLYIVEIAAGEERWATRVTLVR